MRRVVALVQLSFRRALPGPKLAVGDQLRHSHRISPASAVGPLLLICACSIGALLTILAIIEEIRDAMEGTGRRLPRLGEGRVRNDAVHLGRGTPRRAQGVCAADDPEVRGQARSQARVCQRPEDVGIAGAETWRPLASGWTRWSPDVAGIRPARMVPSPFVTAQLPISTRAPGPARPESHANVSLLRLLHAPFTIRL